MLILLAMAAAIFLPSFLPLGKGLKVNITNHSTQPEDVTVQLNSSSSPEESLGIIRPNESKSARFAVFGDSSLTVIVSDKQKLHKNHINIYLIKGARKELDIGIYGKNDVRLLSKE